VDKKNIIITIFITILFIGTVTAEVLVMDDKAIIISPDVKKDITPTQKQAVSTKFQATGYTILSSREIDGCYMVDIAIGKFVDKNVLITCNYDYDSAIYKDDEKCINNRDWCTDNSEKCYVEGNYDKYITDCPQIYSGRYTMDEMVEQKVIAIVKIVSKDSITQNDPYKLDGTNKRFN
jgi:hypothetical protein